LNGKEWNGKIDIYNYKDELIFEGELNAGEKNGYGKEYKDNRLKYEGEFLKGIRHGKGKEYYDNEKISK